MGTGQYLDVLAEARPGQEAQLPDLVDAIQVDLTGRPAAACRYQTRVPTLGRLLALRATGTVGHCWRTVCSGRREKSRA